MCAENLATPSKLDPQDREAAAVLRLLGKLYAWKRKLAKPEPRTSSSVWRGASKEALRSLKNSGRRLPRSIAFHALPSSKLAEACQYALNQWERLKVYLQNGRIEIDQNLCKNAMRALAVGRNWLHIGSQEAGPKIAAILSVKETCKRLQINLRKCLNDVLPQLPS
jgi:transposase